MNGPSSQPSASPLTPFASNPVLLQTLSQWLFTPAELDHTPSILDKMPPETERMNRAKGVNFILQAGQILKIPQLTLATASLYLHRFFMRHSMVTKEGRPGWHHYAIAATALFLATKVEESCRKMKDLVVTFCRVAQKQPNLVVDESSKEYWRWRDTILHNEDILLEALCFDLQLEQPYHLFFNFLCYFGVQDNKNLRNAAWAFLNDSNLTTMRLQFNARTVAASALYAAAKHTDVAFSDDEYGRPWWVHLKVNIEEMKKACNQLVDAYQKNRLPNNSDQSVYVETPEDTGEEATKTRIISTTPNRRSPGVSTESDSESRKRPREELTNGVPEDSNQKPLRSSNMRRSPSPNLQEQRHQPPSPKRPRIDSVPNGYPQHLSYGAASSQPAKDDDIQSRIDSIVNGSRVPNNHISQDSSQPARAPTSYHSAYHQGPRIPHQQQPPQSWAPPVSRPNDYQHYRHRSRSRSPHRMPKKDTYIGAAGREMGIATSSSRRPPSRQGSYNSSGRTGSHDAKDSGSWNNDATIARSGSHGLNERRSSISSRKSEANGISRPVSQEEAEGSEEGELEN